VSQINPQNKCAQLWDQQVEYLQDPLVEIFEMQYSLQKSLASKGRAVDYDQNDFKTNVDDITKQWRNLTLEFAELLERLPFKEWKTYTPEQLAGLGNKENSLEIWYEYADMFHFFINIGLALGVDGRILERLYVTKNAENFERQKRGY
jgi:dimeric dUTPase (all-alpha-NTP-PPase superfamily)